eukprot:8184506-Alexandrium_andersonii.AAC.1
MGSQTRFSSSVSGQKRRRVKGSGSVRPTRRARASASRPSRLRANAARTDGAGAECGRGAAGNAPP